jgi:hypothetical protein
MNEKNKESRFKILLERLTVSMQDHIGEYFHRVLVFATLVAGALAIWSESISRYLSVTLVIVTIATSIILLWLRSILEQDDDLSLFYTFWWDYLKPPRRPGGELEITTEVAIVEDKVKESFKNSVARIFRPKGKEVDEKELAMTFKLVPCAPLRKQNLNERKFRRIRNGKKEKLKKALSMAEAVVFVRTEELDANSWAYESMNEWASKNASVPVLSIKPRSRDKDSYSENEEAEKFLSITDNPKSLPWGLLSRAIGRASAWRSQARYNRAIAFNICFLLLMVISIMYLWTRDQKETDNAAIRRITGEYSTTIQNMYEAMKIRAGVASPDKPVAEIVSEYDLAIRAMHDALTTKVNFQKDVLAFFDDSLEVSYFIRYDNKPYVSVTTETERTKNYYEKDKTSIIGCGFLAPGKVVEWKSNDTARVFDFETDKELPDVGCDIKPRSEPIKSIVCSAFLPSETSNPDFTVGICIFTGSNESILVGKYRNFLRDRTREFSNKFHDAIENKMLTPLAERLKREDAARALYINQGK